MEKMYMIRAGEKSSYFGQFSDNNIVGIGWNELGDLSAIRNLNEIKNIMIQKYPSNKKQTLNVNASQVKRFIFDLKLNDYVITYDSESRIYLVGIVKSDYIYNVEYICHNIRNVEWKGNVSRDNLLTASKNTLGGISTIFLVSEDVKKDVLSKLNMNNLIGPLQTESTTNSDEELDNLKDDIENRAHEFIKDKILKLDWDEMQDLVAALIRSFGFKTKVSPKGPDRGKDIIASSDGLGINDPRILVEVKHRDGPMGSQEIRSFLPVLRRGIKGIYVSTGGFSKDAKMEAERADQPLTLIDLDYLVELITSNYDNFDLDGKAILPLKKLFWPI